MLHHQEPDVVLQATSGKSLKKASKLEKFNHVLSQALTHFAALDRYDENGVLIGNKAFEEEGIFRVSGAQTQIQDVFRKMLGEAPNDLAGDPTATLLSGFENFIINEHNIIGLIKYGLRNFQIQWSKEAQGEFEAFRQSNDGKNKMSFQVLIDNMLKKGLHEEAKALHNLLHLCHRVNSFEARNKMSDSNIGIAIAPSIALFFKNNLAIDQPTQAGLPEEQLEAGRARFIEAMKDPYFSKSYSAQNPQVAVNMAKRYEDNKKYPPIVKPVVVFGIKLPMWLSKVIRFFTGNPTPKPVVTVTQPSLKPTTAQEAPPIEASVSLQKQDTGPLQAKEAKVQVESKRQKVVTHRHKDKSTRESKEPEQTKRSPRKKTKHK